MLLLFLLDPITYYWVYQEDLNSTKICFFIPGKFRAPSRVKFFPWSLVFFVVVTEGQIEPVREKPNPCWTVFGFGFSGYEPTEQALNLGTSIHLFF